MFMGVDWEIINTIELSIKYLNKGMKLVSRGSIGVEMFRWTLNIYKLICIGCHRWDQTIISTCENAKRNLI